MAYCCLGAEIAEVREDTFNLLSHEGYAVKNQTAKRIIYRCTRCGTYDKEIEKFEGREKYIWPDDKKTKMKKKKFYTWDKNG